MNDAGFGFGPRRRSRVLGKSDKGVMEFMMVRISDRDGFVEIGVEGDLWLMV